MSRRESSHSGQQQATGAPLPYLFQRFPGLLGRLPWTSLGRFPTPVERLAVIGGQIGHAHIYVKRDDRSAAPDAALYGGNKVRKLEFTLADAVARGHDTVLTFGAAGSNHVLATTVHARRLGLTTVAVLVDQVPQEYVRRNLLADQAQGCRMIAVPGPLSAALVGLTRWLGPLVRGGARPYLLPPGGSSVRGTLGYVEAALELAAQVRAGRLPAPELVVVPAGTCGTMAGLVAGLALTDLPTRVIGVRVYGRSGANPGVVVHLANRALGLLRRLDPTVPARRVRATDFALRDDWYGRGYARFTRRGVAAVELAKGAEGLSLEGTYSGKAFAAFLDLMSAPGRRDRPALFVATHNSCPLAPLQEGAAGPSALPARLRRYFEVEPAPIDPG